MENPWAGEAALVLDGQRLVLRLTLGALATLEASMDADGIVALVRRFEEGTFTTRDVFAVLLAGLRGGGWDGRAQALLDGTVEGGPGGGDARRRRASGPGLRAAGRGAMTLDWSALMRAGIGGLGLSPQAFWALTPVELALLMGVGARPAPMDRAGLAALAARYPD